MYRIFQLCVLVLVSGSVVSQADTIRLRNPSFEDNPKRGGEALDGISGWFDCGRINFPAETPPDIHPNGYWENNLPASDKKTYLGMVVRDNATYESVSQRLDTFLEAGKCYRFTIHLAKAARYISRTRTTGEEANYITPIVLRIWGGSGYCNERELLAESAPVNNTSWQINTFEFRPKNNIRSVTFSAYYKTPTLLPYNGNLLIDGASDIVRIACPGEPPLLADKSKLPPHKRKKQPATASNNPIAVSPAETEPSKPYKPKIMQELASANIREGQTIEIKNLQFKADSTTFEPSSFEALNEVLAFLQNRSDIIIEVGGHTNNIPADEYCDRLSTARAKSVAEYLVSRGADPTRIQFKGYGKKKPIADNTTKYGRSKNQRVEIKILSIKK